MNNISLLLGYGFILEKNLNEAIDILLPLQGECEEKVDDNPLCKFTINMYNINVKMLDYIIKAETQINFPTSLEIIT